MKKINQKIINGKRKIKRKKIISKKVIRQHQLKKYNPMTMRVNNNVKIVMCMMNKQSL